MPDEVSVWNNIDVSAALREHLVQKLSGFNTVLIGLDGGTKASYESLDLEAIFRDIDGMPMRRTKY